METILKLQDEVIEGYNKNNWLVISVSRVSQGYTKRYSGSHCVVSIIYEKGEAIGILQ